MINRIDNLLDRSQRAPGRSRIGALRFSTGLLVLGLFGCQPAADSPKSAPSPAPSAKPGDSGEKPAASSAKGAAPRGHEQTAQQEETIVIDDNPDWKASLRKQAPYNMILVTLDTTRADHIGCYGGPEGLTPNVDRVAAEGARFEEALSQTNVTNPSHLCIMTGRLAIDHGVLDNKTVFPGEVDLLPAAFKRKNYRTAGFPACHHISTALHWRGFDELSEVPDVPRLFPKAQQVTDRALTWLTKNGGDPFFVWIHYFDAHAPYAPPPRYVKEFYPGDPRAADHGPEISTLKELRENGQASSNKWLSGITDPTFPELMYRAELHYIDDQFGRILKYLDDTGLAAVTGIVVVADHGENLGEHGLFYNHWFIFEPTLRIPMIFKLPGLPKGVRIPERVTHLDIAPTLADFHGLDMKGPLPGLNLLPALKGEGSAYLGERQTIIHEFGYDKQIAVREGPMKVLYEIRPLDTDPQPEKDGDGVWVYDTKSDPEEKTDVSLSNLDLATKYCEQVKRWFSLRDKMDKLRDEQRAKEAQLSPEEKTQLEQSKQNLTDLGYIDEEEDSDFESVDPCARIAHPEPLKPKAKGSGRKKEPSSREKDAP